MRIPLPDMQLSPLTQIHYAVSLTLVVGAIAFSQPVHSAQPVKDINGCEFSSFIPAKPVVAATWSGFCIEGKGSGEGLLTISFENGKAVRYEGQMREGEFHGSGKLTFESGDTKEGNWVRGALQGFGVYVWSRGGRYEGNWVESKRTGLGTESWPQDPSEKCGADDSPCLKVYSGLFDAGKLKCGRAEYYNSDPYEGCWDKDSKRTCKGSTLTPLSRFQIDGDEATDSVTGLTWKRCPYGTSFKRGDGRSQPDSCAGRAEGAEPSSILNQIAKQGLVAEGWRLPTIQELLSITPGLLPNPDATKYLKTNNPLGIPFMSGNMSRGCTGELNWAVFPPFQGDSSGMGTSGEHTTFLSASIDLNSGEIHNGGGRPQVWVWGPGLGGRNATTDYWPNLKFSAALLVKGSARPYSVQAGTRKLFQVRTLLNEGGNASLCNGESWAPTSRYRIEKDVALDTQTGLRWKRCPEGQQWDGRANFPLCSGEPRIMSWKRAMATYSVTGSGWRLPTIDELSTLRTGNSDATSPTVSVAGRTGEGCVWGAYNHEVFSSLWGTALTSSLNSDSTMARLVDFKEGGLYVADLTDPNLVLLVKGHIKPGPLAQQKWAIQPTNEYVQAVKAEVAAADERQRQLEERQRREAEERRRALAAEQERQRQIQSSSQGFVTCWRSEIDSCYAVTSKDSYGSRGIQYTLECYKGLFRGRQLMYWDPSERKPFCASGKCSLPRIAYNDPHAAAADACGFYYNGD